jgi:RimJ/RimL family protein N-acetyltransferase
MQLDSALEGKNFLLRTLFRSDATPDYLNWLWDPEINAFLEIRFNLPSSLDELGNFIENVAASSDSLLLGIFKKNDLKHIGNIKLGPINPYHRCADVGFLIGNHSEWGKGYASGAITTLTDYAFDQLDLAKVTAGCYVRNEGSRRALLKAGFQQEGCQTLQWVANGVRQDGLLFGKLNLGLQ